MKKVLFNLTEEQYEQLGRIAKRMGVSRSEALRKAITLYLFCKKEGFAITDSGELVFTEAPREDGR